MEQRMPRLIVCTMATLLTGCSRPCFYQAGKNLEECRRDLLDCLRSPRPELYMQEKGYQHVDLGKLPKDRTRIKIVAASGEYWVLDGLGMTLETRRVSPVPEPRKDHSEEPHGRIVEYRVERGNLGTFKVTLVYEDDPKR